MAVESSTPVHFLLVAADPRNHSIIDVKHKATGEVWYRKLRHIVPNLYALSLIEPETYTVFTEIQSQSSASKEKIISLHDPDALVRIRQNSRLGFEWTFDWKNEKLKWVKESPLSSTLECRLLRSDMEICLARYLPRNGGKGSYFGVFSVLENNMNLCNIIDSDGLTLIMMTILFTFFDKADDDRRWKKDKDNYLLDLDFFEIPVERPHNGMDQDKLQKMDLETDKKLMKAMQKGERKTEKQLKRSSAYSSATNSPSISPIPSPTHSTTHTETKQTKRGAPLLRSLSYSSRDGRPKSSNKLNTLLTPFTKLSVGNDTSDSKPVRHHHRTLSAGITDLSTVSSYNSFR